jgi:endonuclease YncB( thermonuclease family)
LDADGAGLHGDAGFAGESVLRGPVPARVMAVLDGDTLLVQARLWLDQTLEVRVRLGGIDTPNCAAAAPTSGGGPSRRAPSSRRRLPAPRWP